MKLTHDDQRDQWLEPLAVGFRPSFYPEPPDMPAKVAA